MLEVVVYWSPKYLAEAEDFHYVAFGFGSRSCCSNFCHKNVLLLSLKEYRLKVLKLQIQQMKNIQLQAKGQMFVLSVFGLRLQLDVKI